MMIFRNPRARYIRLGTMLQPRVETVFAEAIATALPPVKPPPAFVAVLEEELRQAAQQQANANRVLRILVRTLGVVGGGMLCLIGVVLLWRHWQQRERQIEQQFAASSQVAPL